jgi:two-component system, cell cycle response regulator
MLQLDATFVRQVLDCAPEAIAICDALVADHPVIYANAAFEQLTGYAAADVLGSNLRLLHGDDRDQEGLRRVREALARGADCRVLLRNYRKGGGLLWNELYLQPMRGEGGAITHWVAFLRDASSRLRSAERGNEGLPGWLREDRVTGLSSRAWFDELMVREWRVARRDCLPLTLVLFDVDALKIYAETFGRAGADACVRRIAGGVSGVFRRGSDVVGMWRDGCIAVLAVHRDGLGVEGVVAHATAMARKVAEMHIHHPRSPRQKVVTVTAGLATVTPDREEESPARLIERAENALLEGKAHLRGGLNQAPD